MNIIITIALIVGFVALAILYISHRLWLSNLLAEFNRSNTITFGKIGRGKGLITQWVINHRRKRYYANISYSKKGDKKLVKVLKSLKEVSCEPNDYKAIVDNNIKKTKHLFKEHTDIFIDDIGIYLPSYMDSLLYKYYPSMPVFYAMSRQLYDMHIHCNTQSLERGWKALREQADFYIKAVSTTKILGFIFITKVITYDSYESAKKGLLPVKARLLNKYSKAEVDLYKAQAGQITQGHIIQFKWNIHYNTRAFEKVLLRGPRLVDRKRKNKKHK